MRGLRERVCVLQSSFGHPLTTTLSGRAEPHPPTCIFHPFAGNSERGELSRESVTIYGTKTGCTSTPAQPPPPTANHQLPTTNHQPRAVQPQHHLKLATRADVQIYRRLLAHRTRASLVDPPLRSHIVSAPRTLPSVELALPSIMARITDLPPELFIIVAEQLSSNELVALCTASTYLGAACGPLLLGRVFGHDCSAFHFACMTNNIRLAQVLLGHGAPVSGAPWTPLHIAASYGRPAIVRLLLAHGADVNANLHHSRFTPLHFAKNPAVAQLLIDAGADMGAKARLWVNSIDFDGTPLLWACRNSGSPGYDAVVKCLLRNGAGRAGQMDHREWVQLKYWWAGSPLAQFCTHRSAWNALLYLLWDGQGTVNSWMRRRGTGVVEGRAWRW